MEVIHDLNVSSRKWLSVHLHVLVSHHPYQEYNQHATVCARNDGKLDLEMTLRQHIIISCFSVLSLVLQVRPRGGLERSTRLTS